MSTTHFSDFFDKTKNNIVVCIEQLLQVKGKFNIAKMDLDIEKLKLCYAISDCQIEQTSFKPYRLISKVMAILKGEFKH
jgi:hypothetical protein